MNIPVLASLISVSLNMEILLIYTIKNVLLRKPLKIPTIAQEVKSLRIQLYEKS